MFTGRAPEVDLVVAWVRSGQPGLHVVTESAGTSKTAIAGRVVGLSNSAERQRLLAEGRPLGHADPGEQSVAVHVHARGLTADRGADVIAAQLARAGVLAMQQNRRNAAELVGQMQGAAEHAAELNAAGSTEKPVSGAPQQCHRYATPGGQTRKPTRPLEPIGG